MSLLNKVNNSPIICKIGFDFTGNLSAVNAKISQNFFNSSGNQYTWKNSHFAKKSISYKELEKKTKAGSEFIQKLIITIPTSDENRSDRISIFKTVKFIKLELSNGQILVMGRNDFFNNSLPEVTTNSDHRSTRITFQTKTMFPLGFLEITNVSSFVDYLLPIEIPIN